MSAHFEIEKDVTVPSTQVVYAEVLIQGAFASTWTARQNCAAPYHFKPMEFDTRGGARNYIHKHALPRGCRIVRVSEGDAR